MHTGMRNDRHYPPRNPTTPWLVYPHKKFQSKSKPKASTVEKHTFCSIPSHNNHPCSFPLKSIPELQGKTALGCFHGWLLLIDNNINSNVISLWNPLSLQTISLPPLPKEFNACYIRCSVLTCPPQDSDSLILLFAGNHVAFCHPGDDDDDAWAVQISKIKGSAELLTVNKVVVCNGALYGCVKGYNLCNDIVVIEIIESRLNLRFIGPTEFNLVYASSWYAKLTLAECCGDVYRIMLSVNPSDKKRVLAAGCWKLDLGLMTWVQVKSLKGHVFFTCNTYTTSSHGANIESDFGGVYFVWPDDKTLYFYNVDTASVTSLLPCPNLTTPWLTPFWILPACHQYHPRLLPAKEIQVTCKVNKHESNRKALDAGNEPNTILVSKLPEDLLTQIAENLPLSDYLNFRSVCKPFYTAAPPLLGQTSTSQKVRNHPSPPWYIVLNNYKNNYMELENDNGDRFLWDVINPTISDTQYSMSIPKLFEGTTITFSNKGWCLTRKGNDSLHFLNPFTRVSGKYPYHERLTLSSAVGFSTIPTSPDCITVGIYANAHNGIYIIYIRSGDESWTELEFEPLEKGFHSPPSSTSLVYVDDLFYFLDDQGYLGAFQIKEKCPGIWIEYEKPVPNMQSSSSFHSCHMVECNGQILVVLVGFMGRWLNVFSWNTQTETWKKVDSLGDQTIFVSPISCFSTAAGSYTNMGNKIYFPRLYNGKSAVFYSMDTKQWHAVGIDEPLRDLYGTKEFLQCTWIQPHWSA